MPRRTVNLLDQLSALGFSDDDFRIMHHMSDATIARHQDYCKQTGAFEAQANNQKVRERLELVFSTFRAGWFTAPAKPGVFRALAQAAVAQIPKETS
jgi:hypothetical protein